MNKYCSDCAHMDIDKAKCDGVYQCKIKKDFTCACNSACEKFQNSYSRNSFEKERLYDLGKESQQNDDTPIENYIIVLFLLGICFLIAKIYGY